MSWHHIVYHLPFNKIFLLARDGRLPKKLLKCRNSLPLCVACQFGQAYCRPWRVKGQKIGSIRKPEQVEPGDVVSVDQIISVQPGLIPQISGFLMNKKIWGCTTFVDHIRNFAYIHLMRDFTLSEAILRKSSVGKGTGPSWPQSETLPCGQW